MLLLLLKGFRVKDLTVFKNPQCGAQVRVCVLLTTQLQNLLDPGCEPALQASDLRVVLRVVRTLLRAFHRQLRSKSGVFVETLLAGVRLPPPQHRAGQPWDPAWHSVLPDRCRTGSVPLSLLTVMLSGAGTGASCTLWQRINVMQVMRQLSYDAHIVHFLFCSYDMRLVRALHKP